VSIATQSMTTQQQLYCGARRLLTLVLNVNAPLAPKHHSTARPPPTDVGDIFLAANTNQFPRGAPGSPRSSAGVDPRFEASYHHST